VARLWEAARKLPGAAVVWPDGLLWLAETALARLADPEAATAAEKKQQAGLEAARRAWLTGRLGSLPGETARLQAAVAGWVAGVAAHGLAGEQGAGLQLAQLGERVELVVTGVELARGGAALLASTLSLFRGLEQPLTRSALASLGEVVVEVQRVRAELRDRRQEIAALALAAQQHAQFLILNLVQQAKKGLVSDRKYSEARLDTLSCLLLAERAMAGPATPQRLEVARVGLGLAGAGGRGGLREEEGRGLQEQLARLGRLLGLPEEAREAGSCHCLATHTDLFPLLLGELYPRRRAAALPLLLAGLQDSGRALAAALHAPPAGLLSALGARLVRLLEEEVLSPLCRDIETELRLSVHQAAGLQLDDRNPFRQAPPDLLPFLRLPALAVLGTRLHLRRRVESYLASTFYNLTTVSLANWRTYGAMRRLAESRLGLATVPDRLPPQTLEQGLDVLEMMRNIHIFTAGYNYNINTQVFVEQVLSLSFSLDAFGAECVSVDI
jgi:WASH complex subunit 7